MPKYVVSSTVTDPEWDNTTVIGFEDVAALREGDGGPINVTGSMALTRSLLKAGLVDEMRLTVFPVILGSGRRLFPDDAEDKVKLELVVSTAFSNGVQYQVFRPQR
jgi:dihydrofolate reductase